MKPGPKGNPQSIKDRAIAQAAAAAELAIGGTQAAAAAAAGVHPETVRRWANASDDEFAGMVRAQKQRLAGWWDIIADNAAAELAKRTAAAPDGQSTRDLAGLMHLASQHQERCAPKDKPEDAPVEQPLTREEFDALARRMGYVPAAEREDG